MRLAWVLLLAAAACSKDDGDKPADKAVDGDKKSDDDKKPKAAVATDDADDARAPLVDAWKKGGLSPSALTAAQVDVGKDCRTGTVGGVDILVCVYDSAADAKAAEKSGLVWVGSTTGAAQAHGNFLIAAADRKKSDPHGKTINQLMKLAPSK